MEAVLATTMNTASGARAQTDDLSPAERAPFGAHSAETIAEARRLIETTSLSVRTIATRLNLPATTLAAMRRRENWIRPDDAPAPPMANRDRRTPAERTAARRQRMLERLYRVFSRQLSDIEARARHAGTIAEEKDARMLGTLARTLGTLMALERDDDGAEANEPESVDPNDIRAKIAQRLFGMEPVGEDDR